MEFEFKDRRNDSRIRILIWQDETPRLLLASDIASALRSRRSYIVWIKTIEQPLNGVTSDEIDELVEWADLLLVTCLRADTLAKLLQGIMDTPLLRLLRSWDVAKKAAIIPAMSRLMWENPMTWKHLSKIRRKWNWIRVFEALIWNLREDPVEAYLCWGGMQECVDAIEHQVDLLTLDHDDIPVAGTTRSLTSSSSQASTVKLPTELWSIILDYTADWELAKTLDIYTTLPVPAQWQAHMSASRSDFMRDLEWRILTGKQRNVVRLFEAHGPPKSLSRLCVKLVLKFSRTVILDYLSIQFSDLFWSHFGHTLIPTKASAVFGQTAILEWWKRSPSFLTKEYNADAIDLASKSGYVHVLQWWRDSGLPLRYTDAALEQASAQGQIEVLDWWRSASTNSSYGHKLEDSTSSEIMVITDGTEDGTNGRDATSLPPVHLKVGKSLIYAAQNGQSDTILWWMSSGIPTVYEEAVARTASANGHVNVLRAWKEIKGEKMQYDNQVLVGPTKNGHVDVLEWWKTSGYRVEYKTCDIEEALEDSVGGQKETSIRRWWARNGLNLGVGTSEWMKVKIL
ncbi:MAG: hypothetical protein L6R41_006866 [Letrouitia leprolyta]|nr:MAG: hypothetical protein L6R41_006866 [Letrouitia leprolyta]